MKGMYFNTRNNTYLYNDNIGDIKVVTERLDDEFINDKFEVDYDKIVQEVSRKDVIIGAINEMGFAQLTLCITDDCNLRCKYCAYSGEYSNTRVHGKDAMSFEVAKKSCDKFLEYFYSVQDKHPLKIPLIGFYGGEPLLNFKLIKDIVNYLNSKYSKINYTISTNAILMDDEIIDFFVENNFAVAISINGDKEENDRLRVDLGNNGTFDSVVDRISRLADKTNIPIQLLATIDTATNLLSIKEFFNRIESDKIRLGRISVVSPDFCDWYSQYTEEEKNDYNNRLAELNDIADIKIKANVKLKGIEELMFGMPYKSVLNRPVNVSSEHCRVPGLMKTGACIPANKIAVDYKGNFHICEKVNTARPIGNCEIGIDIDEIVSTVIDFNKSIEKCQSCSIERLCEYCYARNLDENGKFIEPNSDFCEKMKNTKKELLKKIYQLQEDGVNLYEYFYGK